jgi:hypothetical protein
VLDTVDQKSWEERQCALVSLFVVSTWIHMDFPDFVLIVLLIPSRLETSLLPFSTRPPMYVVRVVWQKLQGWEDHVVERGKKIRAETCLGLMYMKGYGGGGRWISSQQSVWRVVWQCSVFYIYFEMSRDTSQTGGVHVLWMRSFSRFGWIIHAAVCS